MNKNLGPQIINLANQGKSYRQIQLILRCSKGTIAYHLGVGQKAKTRNRHTKLHPFSRKVDSFKQSQKNKPRRTPIHKTQKLLQLKIETFFKHKGQYMTPNFTTQDVIDKLGPNPVCYLTGEQIDINSPRTYHFDHIKPVAKGGPNELENLGICTRNANQAKHDMELSEFINLCKQVLKHHGYDITKHQD